VSAESDQRPPWRAALEALLERHPSATWRAQQSPTAHFWLEIHDEFRRECVALTTMGDNWRDGRITPPELAVIAAPRLRGMVAHLHGHHEIEDYHYFPTFREAERLLAPGFDLLAADHTRLAGDIDGAITTLRELGAAAGTPPGVAARQAADLYVAAADRLFRHLVRHLADEEDLIIPLLLDRAV
jgi:hypothetical protein